MSNPGKHELNPAIIGGGYAGMAAAVSLAARGIPVTVFESAKQLGGRARGVPINDMQVPPLQLSGETTDGTTSHLTRLSKNDSQVIGYSHSTRQANNACQVAGYPGGGEGKRPLRGDRLILDNGQHLLLGCYRETLRLIETVGGNIEDDFLRLPLQLDLHGQFSLKAPRLPAPLHLLIALFSAQGLTFRERLAAVRFMLALQRMNFRLTADMTVSELLALHGQDADLALKLWEPLCIAALNTPVHLASAQVLLNVLRDSLNRARADSDMLLPRLDFTALFPQRAAAFIEKCGGKVHLSCGVKALHPVENGIEITTATGMASFSHVVCAAPPVVAAELLRPIAALRPAVAQIETLQHQPIYTIYLQYPPSTRLPLPMIGLHRRYSQWIFDKGQISGQHGLIACVISAEGIHQELPREELEQKVIEELREEFGLAGQPDWVKTIAEKRATFACTPNLQRPTQQTATPCLLLAGDYTAGDYPATLEGAVSSGVRCASLIVGTADSKARV